FEVMQDDTYLITQDGWQAKTYRIMVENKAKKKVDKGWTCDLVPKELVINRYFKAEKEAIEELEANKEAIAAELVELEEEHSGEDGCFAEMDRINKTNINARLRELKDEQEVEEEVKVLKDYIALLDKQTATNRKIREAEKELDD